MCLCGVLDDQRPACSPSCCRLPADGHDVPVEMHRNDGARPPRCVTAATVSSVSSRVSGSTSASTGRRRRARPPRPTRRTSSRNDDLVALADPGCPQRECEGIRSRSASGGTRRPCAAANPPRTRDLAFAPTNCPPSMYRRDGHIQLASNGSVQPAEVEKGDWHSNDSNTVRERLLDLLTSPWAHREAARADGVLARRAISVTSQPWVPQLVGCESVRIWGRAGQTGAGLAARRIARPRCCGWSGRCRRLGVQVEDAGRVLTASVDADLALDSRR